MRGDAVYAIKGNTNTDQAQNSSANPRAGNEQMRILIELQVISMLLRDGLGIQDDLAKLRQDVADSL